MPIVTPACGQKFFGSFFQKRTAFFLVNILSIQSSVAYGHVGNSSAVFPLQRLGAEVWPVPTVLFSNHPGYGAFTGQAVAPDIIAALIDGIAARGVLASCDAVLSGYIGDAGTGSVILESVQRVRGANPSALWCCDPVIGDDGPGIYVRPGIANFFRDQAVTQADILTPNQFELRCLTALPCSTLHETKRAIAVLQARMRSAGPRVVLVTSVCTDETPSAAVDVLAASYGAFHLLRTPKLPIVANGAGDAIAALFLFHLLRTRDAAASMAAASSSVHGLLMRTLQAGSRELLIVAAQEEFINPSKLFDSVRC